MSSTIFGLRDLALCFCPFILCVSLATTAAELPAVDSTTSGNLPAGTRLVAVDVEPSTIELTWQYDYVQLLLTGMLDTGETIDVTRMAKVRSNNSIVGVSRFGIVSPTRDGTADLTLDVAGQPVKIPVVCRNIEGPLKVDYIREVNPVIAKMGCNAGTCHGSKDGKNGFKLSLRGYDPVADTRSFADDLGARRINRASPEQSLMLLKATGSVPHVGGQLTKPGSGYYEIIKSWIADGVTLDMAAPRVAKIELAPQNPVVAREGITQQVRVLATYTDGQTRDVSREAFVTSGNTDVATANGSGLLTALRRGEAPILARFEGAYTATTLTVMGDRSGFVWQQPLTNNHVDELVYAKLERVKTLPSDTCSDEEFARRVYFDLTGLPPSVEQLRGFENDPRSSVAKRRALVDQLIGSSEFVDQWTNKWADLLQVNRKYLGVEGAKTFRQWIRNHVDNNTPYDEFAYAILTASGSNRENPAASYYKILREPSATMENTTHLFLATRFNCNKCHDHPFERWTQDQYYQLTAFFAQVGLKKDPDGGDKKIGGTAVEGAKPLYEIVYDKDQGEITHDRTGAVTAPAFPYEHEHAAAQGASRREQLARWIVSPHNRYFAKSHVNRIWGYLLGRGLIEPIDDIRAGNPPTNPELLDWLTGEFVANGFNTRELIRTICNSRTYQHSIRTNKWNEDDTINYSHAIPRRLPAEVLFDAIHFVTGATPRIPGVPPGTRAAQLPDVGVKLPSGFLDQFGRPARESACECERSNDVLLGPILALVNGPTISEALADPDNALAKLVQSLDDDRQLVNELFLRILNRQATSDEIRASLDTIAGAEEDARRLRDDYERELATLNDYRETLPGRIAEWEKTQYPPEWQILELVEFSNTMGAAVTKESDGSWVVTGKNGKGEYKFKAHTDLAGITGFRLELLIDERLPNKGPGRADDGNFVLTELKVNAAKKELPDDATEVKLQRAQATFSQGQFDVGKAIDGKVDDRGWAIHPKTGSAQAAIFEIEKDVGGEGTVLTFVVNQSYSSGKHSIGRFRLAVTNSPRPHRLNKPPDELLVVLKIPRDQRSEAQEQVLFNYYRRTDTRLRTFERDVAASKRRLGDRRLLGAQDIAWALINSPAFLFNR